MALFPSLLLVVATKFMYKHKRSLPNIKIINVLIDIPCTDKNIINALPSICNIFIVMLDIKKWTIRVKSYCETSVFLVLPSKWMHSEHSLHTYLKSGCHCVTTRSDPVTTWFQWFCCSWLLDCFPKQTSPIFSLFPRLSVIRNSVKTTAMLDSLSYVTRNINISLNSASITCFFSEVRHTRNTWLLSPISFISTARSWSCHCQARLLLTVHFSDSTSDCY